MIIENGATIRVLLRDGWHEVTYRACTSLQAGSSERAHALYNGYWLLQEGEEFLAVKPKHIYAIAQP